ncbi:MAG: hypothetical protein JF587_16160 [Catenulisporales bacterium]|nr:hypothetical protein [Catenulisporales bacterium]
MSEEQEHPKREPSLYKKLASEGPYGPGIGSALITMVEPHPGHERSYHRWYEDDHYISGAMSMPWMFAGRRWVATRPLQLLRYPSDSAVAKPVTAGAYITVYWINEGRYQDHMDWTVAINRRLLPDGRVFQERTHVFTSFQNYLGVVYRDGDSGPRDIHALNHPYAGLVVEVYDASADQDPASLTAWLKEKHVPGKLEGSPIAMATVFEPMPLPGTTPTYVKPVEGVGKRITVLYFLERDPAECWDLFTEDGAAADASGLGRLEFAAPFIPTLPGTDKYVDELR